MAKGINEQWNINAFVDRLERGELEQDWYLIQIDDTVWNVGEFFDQQEARLREPEWNVGEFFDAMEEQLKATPATKFNEAVWETFEECKKVVVASESYVKEVEKLLKSLDKAIKKFTKTNANAADIASGIFDLASACMRVAALFAKGWPGPVARVFNLIGAVLGAFGSSKKSNYYEVVDQMLKSATIELDSQQTNHQIAGELRVIRELHDLTVLALADVNTYKSDPKKLRAAYNNLFDVTTFSIPGVYTVGWTLDVLNSIVLKKADARDNWANAADTYYRLCDLISVKVMYMVEGLNFYVAAQQNIQAAALADSLERFRKNTVNETAPFIQTPTLAHAAITHELYRMPTDKMSLVAGLHNYMNEANAKDKRGIFWPFDNSSCFFKCHISTIHMPSSEGQSCVRLTTLSAHQGDKKVEDRRTLTCVDSGKTWPEPYNAKVCVNAPFFEKNSEIYHEFFVGDKKIKRGYERTHFALQPIKAAHEKGPYHIWMFAARTPTYEHLPSEQYGMHETLPLNFQDNDMYAFRVFPTDAELKGIATPVEAKVFVMMGSRSDKKVEVWSSSSDRKFIEKVSYYEAVYKTQADRSLWYFLDENEESH